MKGVNHARQVQIIRNAWDALESVCNIKFIPGEYSRKSIRVFFHDNKNMKRLGKRTTTPLGLWLYDWKAMVLNTDRDIGLDDSTRWTGENLILHEFGHSFRIPHSPDKTSVANDNISAKWLNPTDVLWWQRKFGRPTETFWPRDKVLAGLDVRELTAKWDARRQERNGTLDKARRKTLTNKVQKTLKKLNKAVNKWKKLKKDWQSVPMAG